VRVVLGLGRGGRLHGDQLRVFRRDLLPAGRLRRDVRRAALGRAVASTAALGTITGAGLPFLLVAYMQRKGPGTVCWRNGTAGGCDEYLDPRPWLAIGIVLVLAGVGAFVRARRAR